VNRTHADVAVGVLVASILAVGVATAVQLSLAGDAARDGMGAPPVMALVGPVLMSLVVASVVGGVYVFARDRLFTDEADESAEPTPASEPDDEDGAGDDADDASSSDWSGPASPRAPVCREP